jgi:hypothetical protein
LLEQDAAEAEVIVSAHTDAVTDARRALRETILEHANRKPARVPRRIPPPRGVKARPAGRDVRLHLLPLGLLQLLRARLADGGRVLLETYGINHEDGSSPYIHVHRPGDVYPDDEFVYWGFGADSLRRFAELAGITGFQLHATPIIDGHPRIIASLTLATDDALDPAHRE